MNKTKETLRNIFKTKKKFIFIGLPVLLIVLFFIFGKGSKKQEVYAVARQDVVQSVVLSGDVRTSDRADLGFASSGRVNQVFVKNNQKVAQGQTLAQLEIGDLIADLKIKQANSRVSDVDLEAAKDDLDKTTMQENTKVESARRTLLSEDLEAIADSSSYAVTAPLISGIYDGAEGEYKIIIDLNKGNYSKSTIRTYNLERTEEKTINEESSTQLGTRGLYISFPEEVRRYRDTIWLVNIPNKAGSSYLSNFNAYNEAKKNRDSAIKKADAEYQKILVEGTGGESSVAQAEVQKINAEIRKNTVYAPFSGIVTNIEKEVGESVSVGERMISVIGEKNLEVVLQVSELDVSRLTPGSQIKISLDAFPGEDFTGTLQTVNSRDTEVDGVPVYEAFVELAPDPRIKTGMSANGMIVVATKGDVISIPDYFVKKEEGKNTVNIVLENGKTETREVTLGLVGTDSMVEVVSGLTVGENISALAKK